VGETVQLARFAPQVVGELAWEGRANSVLR
jgi:hypothetical protein